MAGDRYLLLVNPSARGGRSARELLPRVEAALRNRDLTYRRVFTESLEHGCAEATDAAAAGEITLVMSGDGLIGQVGGALAMTGATMGIIPGGRGNDLARVLEVPTDPDAAVAVVAAGVVREIDVGQVNGKRFLGVAGGGFDSEANRIANDAKLIRGHLVYAYAALRALVAWKQATFTLTLDGERTVTHGYGVAVANSRAYGGGMFVAPHAELDDGLFDVIYSTKMSKLRFLTGPMAKVFDGRHVDLPVIEERRAATVTLEADRPFAVYADGDEITELPATFTLLPRALRMLVPG